MLVKRPDRSKILDLFFSLKEIGNSFPRAPKEAMAALRLLKVTNSNAIENLHLEPMFLQTALYRGNFPSRVPVSPVYRKAFLEVQGHDKMLRHLEKQAMQKSELSVSFLLGLHRSIFEKSWPDIAGRFRDIDVRIKGRRHQLPHYSQLPELCYQHLSWIDGLLKLLGPVTPANFFEIIHVSADALYRIIYTHPFLDGNGQIAQAVADYVMLYSGMFYNVITVDRRDDYFTAVRESSLADYSALQDFLVETYGETLERIKNFFLIVKQTAGQA